MSGPTLVAWVEEVRVMPRYFTREAWATLSESQRTIIRLQRMSWVLKCRGEHEMRYHHGETRADELARALEG